MQYNDWLIFIIPFHRWENWEPWTTAISNSKSVFDKFTHNAFILQGILDTPYSMTWFFKHIDIF